MNLDANIKSEVEDIIGKFKIIKDHRSNSPRTGVFEVDVKNKRYFVKIHNRLSRWSPEVYAYKNWTSTLGKYTPELIHSFHNNGKCGIVITKLRGKTINEFGINDENILKPLYFKAGELLRKLHDSFKGEYFGIPRVDGSPLQSNSKIKAVDYITESLESIFKSGYDKGLFNNNDRELVEWCQKQSTVFEKSKPVPTNWDFSQNNWMTNEQGEFTGIIDFENMLWGIDVDSFGVMLERYTYNRPSLRKALFDGYKLENTYERKLQIKIISLKIAIADITYGTSIGDDRLIKLGRNLLDNLKMKKNQYVKFRD